MVDILNINNSIIFDESIAHYEIHAHQPFASNTFNNSDEIRIAVQHQDLCILPSKSSLHISGRIGKAAGQNVTQTNFVSCGICHMFEEIRYELNAVEIDRCKNVGLTTLMKNYLSQSSNQLPQMQNAGWLKNDEDSIVDGNGNFDIAIPLSMLLGFAEDYQQIIVNAKHELILIRSSSNLNAVIQKQPVAPATFEAFNIELTKIEWLVPYVKAADDRKIALLNYISKDPIIPISFRAWELYEYPLLPTTSKHVWTVKTSTQLEKPRYVIVGFQTERKNVKYVDASKFDHCNIRDVKLFLNSQSYPYGNMNININSNQFAILYDMYVNFQISYYGKEAEPLLTKSEFLLKAPLIIIDCSHQNEFLKSGPVDIRLEFESNTVFPNNTAAYCLILHDRIIEYQPLSNNVRKIT